MPVTVERAPRQDRDDGGRRGADVAVARRRAGVRDDRRRRRDAADGLRPIDHRVEAAARRHPAAQRGGLAGGVRQVQGDPRVLDRQRGHVARRVQGHLLVGVGASLPRTVDRRGVRAAVAGLLGGGQAAAGPRAEAHRRARAGRPAGRDRLVHGEVGARRAHRREPVPARAASADGVRDPGAAGLARARRGPAATGASAGLARRAALGARCCSRSSSCSRGSARWLRG